MPSTDANFWEMLELSLNFHKEGRLTAALRNYHLLWLSIQESGIDGDNIYPISLNSMLRVLQELAYSNISRNSKVQDLAIDIIKASDRFCTIAYDFLPPKIFLQAEKNNFILQLQGWTGRLGNNLIQIANAIVVAQKTGSIVFLPSHPVLNLNVINYSASYLTGSVKTQWTDYFSTSAESLGFECSPSERRNALLGLPNAVFNFSIDPLVTESTLVIHLRSGDALSGKVGNSFHQPPLNFYRKIIELGQYRDIVIVTEESRINSCAQSLIEQYQSVVNSIRIQHGSLQDDMNTILSAQHLVVSNSSFPIMLGLASKRLKYVHCLVPLCSTWGLSEIKDLEVFDWSAPDYPGDLDWSNVDAACQAMLAFSEEKIVVPDNLDQLWNVVPKLGQSQQMGEVLNHLESDHQNFGIAQSNNGTVKLESDDSAVIIF